MEKLKNNQELLDAIKKEDSKIYPLIELCIKKEIPTYTSCQGHPKEGGPSGYISFYGIEHPKIKEIVKFMSTQDINNKISFYNLGEFSEIECSIHWNAELTEQKVTKIIDVINDKTTTNQKNPLEIITLMEELAKAYTSKNIGVKVKREGISDKTSRGYIEIFNDGSKSSFKLLNSFDKETFKHEKNVKMHTIYWDETIGDKELCKKFNEIIQSLENNKEDDL